MKWLQICDEENVCPEVRSGFELLDQGNHLVEAIAAFEAGLKSGPQAATALFGLGMAYRGLKDFASCLANFERALGRAPHFWPARLQLCLTHLRLGDVASAHQVFGPVEDASADGRPPSAQMALWFCRSVLAIGGQTAFLGEHAPSLRRILGSANSASLEPADVKLKHVVEACLALCENEMNAAGHRLERGLSEPFPVALFQVLVAFLSQQRIGKASGKNVRAFIQELGPALGAYISAHPDSHRLSFLVELVVLVRERRALALLLEQGLALLAQKPAVLAGLLYLEPERLLAEIKTWRPQAREHDPFLGLCWLGLSRPRPDALASYMAHFAGNSSDPSQASGLLGCLHEFCFHLISSGQRHYGRRMIQVMAAVHTFYFGNADPFFRNGQGYLTVDWVSAFGHIIFLEMLLRAEKIGMGPRIPRRIACRPSDAANPAVATLLRTHGFEFMTVPDSNEPRRSQMLYIHAPDGTTHYFMDFMNGIQEQLLRLPSAPCLRLPDAWCRDGAAWLERHGIAAHDRVCVFHCRESTFWTNLYNAFLNARNATLRAYLPALNFLLEQGFVVIRLGDRGMVPAPLSHERFHDLSQAEGMPDWLDFYLCQRADLFLGTNSGPSGVASVFARPCLLTNWFPMNVHISQLNPQNLVMPKLVRTPNGVANLTTMLEDPFSSTDFVERTPSHELVENSPQELLEAVMEMTKRLDGTFVADPELCALERRVQSIWLKHIPWRITMPHSFLSRYGRQLAGGDAAQAATEWCTSVQEGTVDGVVQEGARDTMLAVYRRALVRIFSLADARLQPDQAAPESLEACADACYQNHFRFASAPAICRTLFTLDDSLIFADIVGRPVRRIALAPATKIVLENLDWFLGRFEEVIVGDNFKVGEVHHGLTVITMDAFRAQAPQFDLFLLTTDTPEVEAVYLELLPMDKTLRITQLWEPLTKRHFEYRGVDRAKRILEEIEKAANPLVVLGNKLLATAEPTFAALDRSGYDVFVVSLYDKMENKTHNGYDPTCAVGRNVLVSPLEQLYILTKLKRGLFWIYYDFFCNVGWDARKSMITYAEAATMVSLASRPVILGMYDIIKPICTQMAYCHIAFALYKVMLDQASAVALTSKSDHIAEYLRNTLVRDRPVISFYRYSYPASEPLLRLSVLDGERHLVGVTSFLGEVYEPNRIETRNSIRSILRQKIHFHYYSDHQAVKDFHASLPAEEQRYFHREAAIWDQVELVREMSRYDGGWLVGDEATIFARLISAVEDRHIRELYTLFVPNGVPTSSMTYGAAGLAVFISRQIKVMDEVYPKGCCIPLDMGEVDNLATIFQRLDWQKIHQDMVNHRHVFDIFYHIPRLVAFLDVVRARAKTPRG